MARLQIREQLGQLVYKDAQVQRDQWGSLVILAHKDIRVFLELPQTLEQLVLLVYRGRQVLL